MGMFDRVGRQRFYDLKATREREEDARWKGRSGNKRRKKAKRKILGLVLRGC